MGLTEMSMTRRFVLVSRPESVVIALWDMCSSSRFTRDSRPVIWRRRFDWMERIVRFVRCVKLESSVILFLPSQSSSREVRVSRPSIVYFFR
jgi:hypothetical protein